jgi:Domain of unknown function (DUF1844)
MTQTPHSSPGGQPGGPAKNDEADALARMREELMAISAGDVVAEAAMPLLTLAYARLGLPPEEHARYRDLPAARLLIDALGGMLDAVEGRLGRVEPELRDALARVRMAYVDVTRHASEEHQAAGAESGSREGGPASEPGESAGSAPASEERIARPSGLWVPGQPL